MKNGAHQLMVTDEFQKFIKVSLSGRRRASSGKRITKGTITNYRYVLNLIEEFQELNDITLRIQLLHRASMRTLQREKNYWSRFFMQFSHFLYKDKKYYDNSVLNNFKTIKTFFNYLQQERGYVIGNFHKSFRIPLQQNTPVVLSPEQLKFLISDKVFDEGLNPGLKRARDIFVFGCTVALRYSDLMKLKKGNLTIINGEHYLLLFTKKTTTEIRVPVPDYLLDIIYRNKRKAGIFLLPRLSSTNLNIQVKKLIKKAGWSQVLPKNISLQGRMIELKNAKGGSWQFHEHITSHTMRRTAITTFLILGVPENIVRKISGHAAGSKEFFKYVAIAQEYLEKEVKTAYQKLLEMPALKSLKISA